MTLCAAQTSQWVTFLLCLRLGVMTFFCRGRSWSPPTCVHRNRVKATRLARSGHLPGPLRLNGGPFLARGGGVTQHWPLVQYQHDEHGFLVELLMIRGCWGCEKLSPHLSSGPFVLKCQGGWYKGLASVKLDSMSHDSPIIKTHIPTLPPVWHPLRLRKPQPQSPPSTQKSV